MGQISKQDLVVRLIELDDIETKASASRIIEHLTDIIKSEVIAGNQVNFAGLCTFKPAIQSAKSGKVPGTTTGATYNSPEKRIVKIVASAPFKTAIAG